MRHPWRKGTDVVHLEKSGFRVLSIRGTEGYNTIKIPHEPDLVMTESTLVVVDGGKDSRLLHGTSLNMGQSRLMVLNANIDLSQSSLWMHEDSFVTLRGDAESSIGNADFVVVGGAVVLELGATMNMLKGVASGCNSVRIASGITSNGSVATKGCLHLRKSAVLDMSFASGIASTGSSVLLGSNSRITLFKSTLSIGGITGNPGESFITMTNSSLLCGWNRFYVGDKISVFVAPRVFIKVFNEFNELTLHRARNYDNRVICIFNDATFTSSKFIQIQAPIMMYHNGSLACAAGLKVLAIGGFLLNFSNETVEEISHHYYHRNEIEQQLIKDDNGLYERFLDKNTTLGIPGEKGG